MKIAIEGCAHGELEKIYDTINFIEKKENFKVDLLLCCGDFQSTRNLNDLECMAIPRKYHDICSFYKYYSGEKMAPVLTIFIGGNHEASNYLQELPYGGWVAPNIYYLGYAGVVNVNGVRICGISGIYKGHDFFRGRYEFSPYNESTKRSVYHTRQIDVFRLKQLTGNIDICLSHDWPRGIHNFGNSEQLLRFKPFFREDIEKNQLGSPPFEDLLNTMQPSYWFSAHLHCKFSALVNHDETKKSTKFLALDKCLPKRQFLQILDIGENIENSSTEKLELEYDLEWLTILYLTNHLISVKNATHYMPGQEGDERFSFNPSDDELLLIRKKFENSLKIPLNFTKTVEGFNSNDSQNGYKTQPKSIINPQTTNFCDKLGIDDPLCLAMMLAGEELNISNYTEEEISLIEPEDINSSYCESIVNTSIEIESPKIKAPLAMSLPKPKWVADVEPGIEPIEADSVLENCDNKWIEDRTPDASLNSSIDDSLIDKTSETSVGSELNSVLMNTTDRPVKKFKRRNESIYNNDDD